MSSRVTRSRARSETPQTAVTDFFKTTKNPRTRGPKKIIEETDIQETITVPIQKIEKVVEVRETEQIVEKHVPLPAASIFEKKSQRTRARTPTRQAELNTPELTGTPPKKSKEVESVSNEAPVLSSGDDVILESGSTEKSALDVLMEAAGDQKKKKGPRTVADLQARLAAKGAARGIHEQNLKNKAKQVDEHAELLKSPKKKLVECVSPMKPKAARNLFSPKKSVPSYVVPGFNVQKSAEKIREEEEDAYEEEGKRITAEFLKVSRLTEEVKESVRNRIQLPSSYEHLVDAFKRVDQIASIVIGQNRSCVASELFKNVKNISGRDFSEVHLAQILHVYPQSYQVEMREQRKQGSKYELVVNPNLYDDLRGFVNEKGPTEETEELPLVCPSKLLSPKKSPRKQVQAAPRKPEIDGRKRLDAARQRDRAHVFRHKLSTIVQDHHFSFLESQGLGQMPEIKRFHPLFRLEKHCPALPQAQLPEAPIQKITKPIGMKEYLDNNSEVPQVNLPSFVQKAINDLKSPEKSTTGAAGNIPLSPKKFSEMQKEQKKAGGMSLLERIRAKEAIKKAADACIDKDLEKRKMRLCLLKSKYVRIVCNHYTAKKAQTMEIDAIAKFVQFSSANSSAIPDIVDHLRLLCEVAPMYVTETVLMHKKYLRISDNNLEAITELIEEDIQKTQRLIDEQRNTQISQMSHTPRPSKAARALKFH